MEFLQKSCLLFALSLPVMAYANSPQTPVMSAEEMAAADFCDFATYGVARIAAARQADVSKSELINAHNQGMNALKSQSNLDAFTASTLDQYWKDAIERLYQEPIQKTDAEKQAFVMAVAESSFDHCLTQTLSKTKS